jgi:hypothetical protein
LRLYHRTSREAARAILTEGFRDETYRIEDGNGEPIGGVELSSVPYDLVQRTSSERKVVLVIEIPDDQLEDWEWFGLDTAGQPFEVWPAPPGFEDRREFFVPAEIVNRHGPPGIVTEE